MFTSSSIIEGGTLSIQKNPKSSSTSIADDFPAPDMPVTTNMLEDIRSITAQMANTNEERDNVYTNQIIQ
jgi:hypothetical protein